MNPSPVNDPSPADLLSNFNGRSLKSIIVFTLVVHAALLLGTGGPYLWRSLFGADSSKMSESERMDLAFKEASASMRRIAEEHGLKPQDLGNRFSNPVAAPAPAPAAATATPATPAAPAAPAATEAKVDTAPEAATTTPTEPEAPKSAIEQELKKAVPGPAVPAIEDEDLFK
jgi:hypothetical protein